jgi:hypothetical protein
MWQTICPVSPRKVPNSDAVVGLVWSNYPDSYAGGSKATARPSGARQVKGDDSDKKEYLGPPGRGLGVRLPTSPHKKVLF